MIMVAKDVHPGDVPAFHGAGEDFQISLHLFLGFDDGTVTVIAAQNHQVRGRVLNEAVDGVQRTGIIIQRFLDIGDHQDFQLSVGTELQRVFAVEVIFQILFHEIAGTAEEDSRGGLLSDC